MAELWPIMSEQIRKNSIFVVIFLIWIKGYHRLLVRFSAKCPNRVIFGMVVANDIENIFAKFQPPELI